jgi:hypothetical protein
MLIVEVNDNALFHGHARGLKIGFEGLRNYQTEAVLIQKVTEKQDRYLIMGPLAHHVDPSKTSQVVQFDQGVFHGWITQRDPLLHQLNPEHDANREVG